MYERLIAGVRSSAQFIFSALIIHMNGRVYDYNVGRFLSVDPFIQKPSNSQSVNPYSYIMNNPLMGTDPSGYKSVCGEKRRCDGIIDYTGRNGSLKSFGAIFNGAQTQYFKDSTKKIAQLTAELVEQGGTLIIGASYANDIAEVGISFPISYSLEIFYSDDGDFIAISVPIYEEDSQEERPPSGLRQFAGDGIADYFEDGWASTTSAFSNWSNFKHFAAHFLNATMGLGGGFNSLRLPASSSDGILKSITVIGKLGHYEKFAKELGANYFKIPSSVWTKMTKTEIWNANRTFLDRAIKRGDDFMLSSPIKNIKDVSGVLRRELDYLVDNGYKLNGNGTGMIRK